MVWTASELHYAGQPDWSSETRLPARPLFTNQDPYKHLGLGRLLCGLGTPQVVARGVRRAQRREARLGDVDGGRRLVARRRGHLDLDLVHLAGDDRFVAAGGGDALAGPQVDGPMTQAVPDSDRPLHED